MKNFAIVVYGGSGPTHCCDFIRDLPFGLSLLSPYASVFSAFGSSTTDLIHQYSKYLDLKIWDGKTYFNDYTWFNDKVNSLLGVAKRDIKGEGFLPEEAHYILEITGDEKLNGKSTTDNIFYSRKMMLNGYVKH